ncbi:MAG: ribose-phosphate diphosphokinase [Crenarchaeota archaeon]|nr:ribose-phosphate diphosphokinase [Thermoproteota archaeon]
MWLVGGIYVSDKVVVVSGHNYVDTSIRIADELHADFLDVKYKRFPDGEIYVKIEEPSIIRGSIAVVVSTMYPDQNDSLVETLFLLNAVKRYNPQKIILCIPYLAYARQDKEFLPGEAVSGEVVINILSSTSIDALVVVDIHAPHLLDSFKGYTANVLISDLLVEEGLKTMSNPIILAPDKGAIGRARYAAEKHGLEYDYLEKHRDRITGEITIKPKNLSVKNRDVIIVDDIISTGGTIAKAAEMVLGQGARKVYVAASHALLINDALAKIRRSGAKLILTANTLARRIDDELIRYVDISSRLADTIESLLH